MHPHLSLPAHSSQTTSSDCFHYMHLLVECLCLKYSHFGLHEKKFFTPGSFILKNWCIKNKRISSLIYPLTNKSVFHLFQGIRERVGLTAITNTKCTEYVLPYFKGTTCLIIRYLLDILEHFKEESVWLMKIPKITPDKNKNQKPMSK